MTADQRGQAAWFREVFGGGWSGAAKIDSFVRLAEQLRAAGRADAAASTLSDIAMGCYWAIPARKPGGGHRGGRAPAVSGAEPDLLLVLASADPVRRGAAVNAALEVLPPDTPIRPG